MHSGPCLLRCPMPLLSAPLCSSGTTPACRPHHAKRHATKRPDAKRFPLLQDNNWLLLECALSLPLAVGLKTAVVSRLLAAALVLEAVTCWPVWDTWPSW